MKMSISTFHASADFSEGHFNQFFLSVYLSNVSAPVCIGVKPCAPNIVEYIDRTYDFRPLVANDHFDPAFKIYDLPEKNP